MRTFALAAIALVFFAAAASAMTPATAKYLSSIGIDPKSKEVLAVDKEGPVITLLDGDEVTFSLDSIAALKRKHGIAVFIEMRGFIRLLKKDFAGTSLPYHYTSLYLTEEETVLFQSKRAEKTK